MLEIIIAIDIENTGNKMLNMLDIWQSSALQFHNTMCKPCCLLNLIC